jgi:hypothetical protein
MTITVVILLKDGFELSTHLGAQVRTILKVHHGCPTTSTGDLPYIHIPYTGVRFSQAVNGIVVFWLALDGRFSKCEVWKFCRCSSFNSSPPRMYLIGELGGSQLA